MFGLHPNAEIGYLTTQSKPYLPQFFPFKVDPVVAVVMTLKLKH